MVWLAAMWLVAEVHTVPPPGVAVPAEDRAVIESGLAKLSARIEKMRWNPFAVDVAVYAKTVRFALQYNEFFKTDDIERANADPSDTSARCLP